MISHRAVTAYAPATVGNVICGFDVLGLALETPGDRVTVRLSGGARELRITGITGDGGRIPTDPALNSATVAVASLLRGTGRSEGLEIEIEKGLPLSGGMGGSAASAVAAAVAADRLLDTALARDEILRHAVLGERVAAGGAHLDNVAPALAGGILLTRPSARRTLVGLPVPPELTIALLHPRAELRTEEARAAMGDTVRLADAVAQWGNTAAFVHALHTADWDLLADALEDRVAEPARRGFIPGFGAVRRAALAAGAAGCGISGAGPSIVAFCRGAEQAADAGAAMLEAHGAEAGPGATLYRSRVSAGGARIVSASGVGP